MTVRKLGCAPLLLVLLLVGACGGGGGGTAALPIALTYTAIGASDAVGVGAWPGGRGYVPLLGEKMRTRVQKVTVVNLGVNGYEVDEMVEGELPAALASDPDIVTVWTGANDLVGGDDPDVFAAWLDQLLSGLASGTGAQVFVGDLVDLTRAPRFVGDPDPDVTTARVEAFNQRIRAAVAKHGFVLVALSAIPMTDEFFWIDGFHPNNEGHAAMAAAFWQQIAPRLPR